MHVAGGAGAGAAAFRLDAGDRVLDRGLHDGRAELALDGASFAVEIDVGDFGHALGLCCEREISAGAGRRGGI